MSKKSRTLHNFRGVLLAYPVSSVPELLCPRQNAEKHERHQQRTSGEKVLNVCWQTTFCICCACPAESPDTDVGVNTCTSGRVVKSLADRSGAFVCMRCIDGLSSGTGMPSISEYGTQGGGRPWRARSAGSAGSAGRGCGGFPVVWYAVM